jgi:hypothetical protein
MQARNPYAAPEAKLADPAPAPGSSVKAVTLGVVVDILGSTLGTLLLGGLYGIYIGMTGASTERLEAAAASYTSGFMFYVANLIGLFFSLLGGYVCARIARQSEYRLGAIVAAVSAAIGLAFTLGQHSALWSAAVVSVNVAFVMLGVHWGKVRTARERR